MMNLQTALNVLSGKKMDGLDINFDQYGSLELFFHGDNDIKSNINMN